MASSSTSSDSRGNVDIVGAPAVVEWPNPTGQPCYLSSSDSSTSEAGRVTFDLHFRPGTSTASLRLRAPIMLKGLGRKMTPLFLFIPPERIESLAFVGQEDTRASEDVQKELGASGAVSLRVRLMQPSDLVVPPLNPVIPKKKVYWDVFDSLRSLAQALDFVVYLSLYKSPSEESVRGVVHALSTGEFATSLPHADISRLYDGKGGKLLTGSDLTNKPAPAPGPGLEPVDSPPSYDELEPGPPAPPVKEGKHCPFLDSRRKCANSHPAPTDTAEPSSSNSSRKRRRRSNSSSCSGRSNPTDEKNKTVGALDAAHVEAVCRRLISEASSQWRAEGELQLRNELGAMESRMKSWVDGRLSKHAEDLKDEIRRTSVQPLQNNLDDSMLILQGEVEHARDETQDTMDRIDEVKEDLGKAREETEGIVDERVDERVEVLRAELEEYVTDQVHEAEDRVIDRLRSSVFIDFNIYDT